MRTANWTARLLLVTLLLGAASATARDHQRRGVPEFTHGGTSSAPLDFGRRGGPDNSPVDFAARGGSGGLPAGGR